MKPNHMQIHDALPKLSSALLHTTTEDFSSLLGSQEISSRHVAYGSAGILGLEGSK